ncbi:MAG: hypothetical protein AAB276_06240 [Pseudomonadota bacterium]
MAANSTSGGIFSRIFISPPQAIVAAGAIALPHSLGIAPKLIWGQLICGTADAGYSIGDVYPIDFGAQGNSPGLSHSGVAASPDATNMNIIFGASLSPATIFVLQKGTKQLTGIVNTSWSFIAYGVA